MAQVLREAAHPSAQGAELLGRINTRCRAIQAGVPFKAGVELYPHQTKVLKQLWRHSLCITDAAYRFNVRGSILAAVMGAGKTVMALAYALSRVARGPTVLPSLIISSRTLLDMWKTQGIDKFVESGTIKVLYLHHSFVSKAKMDSLSRDTLLTYDLVVTTYDFIRSSAKATKAFDDIKVMGRLGVFGESPNKLKYVRGRTHAQANDPTVVGRGVLFKTPWSLVITDESHKFGNYKTQLWKAMMSIYGREYLCLTGTPVPNYDTDIWSLFRSMGYMGVITPRTRKSGGGWRMQYMESHGLRARIVPVTHADIPPLPVKHDVHYPVPMTALEKQVNLAYLKCVSTIIQSVRGKSTAGWVSDDFTRVLAGFTKLRFLATAPWLLDHHAATHATNNNNNNNKRARIKDVDDADDEEDDDADDEIVGSTTTPSDDRDELHPGRVLTAELYTQCVDRDGLAGVGASKVQKVIEIATTIQSRGEKAVLFDCFTTSLGLVNHCLRSAGIRTRVLTGATKPSQRADVVDEFQTGDATVLLVTYSVGGEGLNITTPCHVIIQAPWWNMAAMNQAIARVWRPGQTRPVTVHWLTSVGTIEESMMALCGQKARLQQVVLGQPVVGEDPPPVRLNFATIARIIRDVQATLQSSGTVLPRASVGVVGGGGGGGARAMVPFKRKHVGL